MSDGSSVEIGIGKVTSDKAPVDIDRMNIVLNTIFDPRNEVPDREKYTQQRQLLVEKIQRRSPEDIHGNYERAIRTINNQYLDQQSLADLDTKADVFEQAFESAIFESVVHGSIRDLGDTVVLKSPNTLAKEQGKPVDEVSISSGSFDVLIGNTDYVFANSTMFPSRSSGGPVNYRIDSDNGYVVPMDIADFRPTDEHSAQIEDRTGATQRDWKYRGDPASLTLGLYAQNIYSFTDFKSFYARYNALLFDTPLEAVNYYKKFGDFFYRHPFSGLSDGQRWASGMTIASDREHEIALKMKEMFVTDNIYPPFIPEFQFKKEVEATKVHVKYPLYPLETL